MHRAERSGRIAREPDGQWDITKTHPRRLDGATAKATIDDIASTMRDARLNWPAQVSSVIAADLSVQPPSAANHLAAAHQ